MLADTTTPDGYTVNGDGAWLSNGVVQTQTISPQPTTTNQETYSTADTSDNTWSFDKSTDSGNTISSTGTVRTGYNGIKLLTDEEAYQKILEIKKEHPDGTKERDCPAMVEWVKEAFYGNSYIYLPTKDFDWDDLHVGDEIWYSNAETTSHRVIVMEIHNDYILAAESGYAGKVKYGRKITRDEIENEFYKVEITSAWQ